jgi:hypothetical protein
MSRPSRLQRSSGNNFRPFTVCHTLLQKATFPQVK